MRLTEQRKIILEELMKAGTHPTATEVYQMVRKRLPHVSLGTIYRNLEILAQAGRIKKLELAGSQKRFDGRIENHYHVRCVSCGRVEDVPVSPIAAINEAVSGATDYDVLWHRLEFEGLCPRCKNRQEKAADSDNAADESGASVGAARPSLQL